MGRDPGLQGGCWFGLNSNWFGDYYMDVGTGQSDVTGQAQVGLGYSFGWSDLSLSYRHLYYNPGDSTRLVENLTLSWPVTGMDVCSSFR